MSGFDRVALWLVIRALGMIAVGFVIYSIEYAFQRIDGTVVDLDFLAGWLSACVWLAIPKPAWAKSPDERAS